MAYAERNKNRKKELKLQYEQSVLERIGFQCQCGCGTKIGDVPRRRFNWDHVDRSTKVDTISTMKGDRYSLQEFKDELDKCQLLLDIHHHAVTRAQNAGQIIDYRLPRLHRDWDMFPASDTTSAKMNALSEWQDPHSIAMYDRWIQCVPTDVNITYEEWQRFGWSRIMLEGVWYVHRDINGKLLSGYRKTDGAQLEIHWLHGVRLRQTKQTQLT